MTGPSSFGPGRRLPAKAEFDLVFAEARFRIRRHPFMLLARPRPTEPSRLGLVVGKKHARRAVRRNLIRRLARESFRVRDFPCPVDVVLLARPGAADVDRSELRTILDQLWDRLERDLRRVAPEHEA